MSRWFLIALGVVALVACGDSLAPEDVVGTWLVQSVNGATVPGEVTYAVAVGTPNVTEVWNEMRFELGPAEVGDGWRACDFLFDTENVTSPDNCGYRLSSRITIRLGDDLAAGFTFVGEVNGGTMVLTDDLRNNYILRRQ